jgi:hypothetical protein
MRIEEIVPGMEYKGGKVCRRVLSLDDGVRVRMIVNGVKAEGRRREWSVVEDPATREANPMLGESNRFRMEHAEVTYYDTTLLPKPSKKTPKDAVTVPLAEFAEWAEARVN